MTKEFMTICLVSQEYPPETGGGGIGTQTFLKAHGLAALGHTVHVISSTYDGLDRTEPDGPVVVHRLRHPACDTEIAEPSAHWVAYSWAVAKKIYELLEEIRFDLIEFPEYGAEGFIYQIDAYSYHRIPIVVMLHGSLAMFSARAGWPEADTDFYRLGTFMEDTVVRRADGLMAGSHNIARFWAERCHIPIGEIAVVHVATDAAAFAPAPARANGRPTVLFVGRIDDEKGVFDGAEAVLRLREKYPDILFRIVGAGDEEDTELLRQKIEGNGAQKNFELVGYVPFHELAPYYAACDVFASPAPNEHGPAGVNLEAMACGKPVVASTQGGAPEAVVDGQTGLLVPPGDTDALVRAFDTLLGHPDLREQLGRNGRRRVLDYFSVDKYAARVETIYKRLIANFKASPADDGKG